MRDALLQDLVQIVEGRVGRTFVASILALEGQELRHAAAPGLPAYYQQAVDGVFIGPHVGSCGTAAFCRRPVYVADISTDPLWAPYSHLAKMALEVGLRACWSVPIVCGGKVLGTFGLYHREPRVPTAAERDLIAEATRPAAILFGRASAGAASNSATGIFRG
jgi:GAF domain-containing protein